MKIKLVLLFACLLFVQHCYAENNCKIVLNNGSAIIGELISFNNGKYTIKTDDLGELTIESNNLSELIVRQSNFSPKSLTSDTHHEYKREGRFISSRQISNSIKMNKECKLEGEVSKILSKTHIIMQHDKH